MRLIDLQKAETGYTIRFSKFFKIFPAALFAWIWLPLVIVVIWTDTSLRPDPMLLLTLPLSIFICLFLFRVGYGSRVVIDETGVHQYSFKRLKHSILWRYVKSFGVDTIFMGGRSGHRLAFYVCTEEKPGRFDSRIACTLHKQDEQAILESGLLTYCRAQIDRVR